MALLKKLKGLDEKTLVRLRRRHANDDKRRGDEQFLFIDLRLCQSVLKTGKRLSRFYHTVVVTDRYALAAHEYWHMKTGGIWGEFLQRKSGEDSSSDDDANDVLRKKKHKEFLQARDSRNEPRWARDSNVGTSGKLISLRHVDENTMRHFDGTGRAGYVELTISFSNPFQALEVSVNFEVREVSSGQFEVRIVKENRTFSQKGKVTEMSNLFDQLDVDKSGTIDRKEFAKIFELAASPTKKRRDDSDDSEDDDPKWKWSKQLKKSMSGADITDWLILQTELAGTTDAIGYVSTADIVNGHTGANSRNAAFATFNKDDMRYTPRKNLFDSGTLWGSDLGATCSTRPRRPRSASYAGAPPGWRRPSRMT